MMADQKTAAAMKRGTFRRHMRNKLAQAHTPTLTRPNAVQPKPKGSLASSRLPKYPTAAVLHQEHFKKSDLSKTSAASKGHQLQHLQVDHVKIRLDASSKSQVIKAHCKANRESIGKEQAINSYHRISDPIELLRASQSSHVSKAISIVRNTRPISSTSHIKKSICGMS